MADRYQRPGWFTQHVFNRFVAWLTAKLDIVGIFPDYESARKAWKAKAQQTVDQAQTRYFIVHMHRLLDPETESGASPMD